MSSKNKYIIATSKGWHEKTAQDLGGEFILINKREDLNLKNLKEINPKFIFFPHWSYIIYEEIYKNFNCVIFHMTDLPYGRGGSPLQNLIVRGHKKTKISAIQCVKELDAGDIYLKKDLDLSGTAEEIFQRTTTSIKSMIKEIIELDIRPTPQEGEIVEFKRRKPEDGDISKLKTDEEIYNYIRMLDADTYPKAFLEIDNFKLEFEEATFKDGNLTAKVKFTNKE